MTKIWCRSPLALNPKWSHKIIKYCHKDSEGTNIYTATFIHMLKHYTHADTHAENSEHIPAWHAEFSTVFNGCFVPVYYWNSVGAIPIYFASRSIYMYTHMYIYLYILCHKCAMYHLFLPDPWGAPSHSQQQRSQGPMWAHREAEQQGYLRVDVCISVHVCVCVCVCVWISEIHKFADIRTLQSS